MGFIKDFFRDVPILSAIMALFIVVLVFLTLDGLFSNKTQFNGIVIDKQYKLESTSVGTGIIHNNNNGPTVISTIDTEPEKFVIIVQSKNGHIYTANSTKEIYYTKSKGQIVNCYHNIGLFSNSIWSTEVEY